jgi:hypothetical protein
VRSSNDEYSGWPCPSSPSRLETRARRPVALGAAISVLGAGRFHVYAFERGQARQPGEDIGELLFEIGSVALAHRSGELAGFLDQPAKSAVPAAPAVLVEIDVTDAPLELGDRQCVSIAKKRVESSKPAGLAVPDCGVYSCRARPGAACATSSVSGGIGEVDLELAERKLR